MNIPNKLNPATIGHLRKMDEMGFSELDTNDIFTLLQYVVLYTLKISEVKTLTKERLKELTDDMAFTITANQIEDIVKLIDEHIKMTHQNDFEAINPHDKGEKKTIVTE